MSIRSYFLTAIFWAALGGVLVGYIQVWQGKRVFAAGAAMRDNERLVAELESASSGVSAFFTLADLYLGSQQTYVLNAVGRQQKAVAARFLDLRSFELPEKGRLAVADLNERFGELERILNASGEAEGHAARLIAFDETSTDMTSVLVGLKERSMARSDVLREDRISIESATIPIFALSAGVFVIGCIGLLGWIRHRLTDPIQKLAESAEAISGAGVPFAAPRMFAKEHRSLAESLGQMTSDLEQTVKDRTAELASEVRLHERTSAQLNTLQKLSDSISRENEVSAVAETVARFLQDRFAYANVTVMWFDEREEELVAAHVAGVFSNMIPEDYRQGIAHGVMGKAARGKEPVIVADVRACEEFFELDGMAVRSEAAYPLLAGERLLGMLNIDSSEADAFPAERQKFLQSVADSLAVAFQRAELIEKLGSELAERERAEQALSESEARFRQSQKLESIGRLAAGVAHDFNNLLTVIQGNATMILEEEVLDEEVREMSEQIEAASGKAAELTRHLLVFSRKHPMRRRPIDLYELIQSMIKMLDRMLGGDISVKTRFEGASGGVNADGTMLEQVLMNLAVNARDAMPKGGQLVVACESSIITEEDLGFHPEGRAGKFICMWVEDTGGGISREHRERLFEPFFTTKKVGQGTGLGLSTVYGIVKEHEGWIELVSEEGFGSRFLVYLPAVDLDEEEIVEVDLPPVKGGTETILLVEDEAFVNSMVTGILKKQGYRVLRASNGEEALEVWKHERENIDLLFTDMVMPGSYSGRDLAEALSLESPELKVLYTSGYSVELAREAAELLAGNNFLQKPYPSRELLRIVRARLDQGPEN